MKLTNRDKKLLLIVSICLGFGFLYYFAIKPQLIITSNLEKQAKEYMNILESMKVKASPDNPVFKEYKILNAKTQNLLQKYYPQIIQEKLILMLEKNIKNSGVKIKHISFSEPSITEIKPTEVEKQQQSNELEELRDQILSQNKVSSKQGSISTETSKLPMLEKMTIDVELQGSYGEVCRFINGVEQENRSIACNNIKINTQEENIVAVSVFFDVYAMPKPFDQDNEYLSWDIKGIYGKANPFGYIAGAKMQDILSSTLPSNLELGGNIKLEKSDFFISIRPVSSDLPTVTMGKFDDNSRQTYLYSDNSDYENVELQVIQEDNRFYYRYRTQESFFPRDYSNDKIEFKPVGNELSLLVISSSRNKEKDENGVKLSIINKTTLNMKVIVQDDDKELQRLRISKLEGDVQVNKK